MDANYNITYTPGTVNVTQATLIVTANNKSRLYGAANPAFDASITGFVNGEILATSDVTGTASCTSAAVASSPVSGSPYTITCTVGTLTSANYSFSFVTGDLAITTSNLLITASSDAMVYGGTVPTITPIYSGLQAGDLAPATAPTCSTAATNTSPVGSYPSTCIGAVDTNYNISYGPGNVDVTQASLLITASSGSMVYGGVVPIITPIYSGLQAGDLAPATAPTCSTTATNTSSVGSYPSTCIGAVDANYLISYAPGNVSVTAAILTVTANGDAKAYDNIPYSGGTGVVYSGFVPGDTAINALGGALTYSGTSQGAVDQGAYAITPGGLTANNGNYTFNYVNGTLTISPTALTVTAVDDTKTYDGIAYSGGNGVTYAGFAIGDTALNSLGGTLAYSGTSQGAVNQGTYVITPGGLTANNGNYAINYVNGTLNIGLKVLTVTANDDTKAYDGNAYAGGNGVTYGGFAPGDNAGNALGGTLTYSGTSQGAVNQGTYVITPGGLTAANYTITYVNGALNINPIALTVTAVNDAKAYDSTAYSGGNGVTYAGFAPGDNAGNSLTGTVTYSGTSQGAVNQGTYVITPGGLTANNGNYTISYQNGTLTISPIALTVTANADTKAYDGVAYSGGNGVTYAGFAPGDNVGNSLGGALTYSGTSQGAVNQGSYVITPSGLTANNGNYTIGYANGTLTITPTALTVTATDDAKTYNGIAYSGGNGVSYTGFAPGDNAGNALGGTLVYSGTSQGAVNQGTYVITPGGLTANNGNYTISYANGTLTIGLNILTVTAINDTKAYDGNAYAGGNGVTYSGFAPGDNAGNALGGTLTYSGTSQGAVNQGTYVITPGGLTANNGNYTISYQNGTLTISPIALTVTANADNKIYDSIPYSGGNGVTYTGFAIGDNAGNSLGGALAYSGTSQGAMNQGGYIITPGGQTANNGNYTISFANGALTIGKRPVTVTAVTDTKAYDGNTSSAQAPTITLGTLAGTDAATLTQTFDTKDIGTNKVLTPLAVISDGNGGNNYLVTYINNNTGVIAGVTVTFTGITANNKIYDGSAVAPLNTVSAALVGVAPGDNVQLDVTGATGAFTNKNVGNGKIVTVSGLVLTGTDAANYALIPPVAPITANITTRPITVTAQTNTKVYDSTTTSAAIPTISVGTPLAPGDTAAFTQTYDTQNVGTSKTLTPGGAVADGNGGGNYLVTFVNNTTGVINARPLTITAAPKVKALGAGDPPLTYSVTAGSLAGADSLSGTLTRVAGEGAGTYAILQGSVSAGPNYNLTYVGANLTIAVGAQAITVGTSAPANAAYNTNFNVTATASSGLPVTITTTGGVCSGGGVNGIATITMLSGTGTCTVHFNQAGDANFTAAAEIIQTTAAQKANQTINVNTPAPANVAYNTGFNVAATATSGLPVTYSAAGVCTNVGSNFTMTSGTGACTVQYNQAGDANYNAAPQVTNTANAQKVNQTINVTTSAPAGAVFGSNFTVASNATSGLAVAYSAAGSCSNAGATFTMTAPTGVCTVQFNQAGNANYNAAAQVTQTVNAQKANQTITVTTSAPANAAFGTTFTVAATSSSGLAVTYTSAGSCTNVGATFTVTSSSGSCTVQYNQAGNANYNAAPQVTEFTNSLLTNQTINVTTPAPANAAFGSNFTVAATATSGLPVAYSAVGSCTNVGAIFTMTGSTGACTVQYNQAGNANFNAAPQVTNTTNAQKANQTITVTTPAPATAANGSNFTVAATSSSGLAVAYSATGSCTNAGAVFTMTSGTGTCTVHYNQAGDANYNAATEITTAVTAQKGNQTINVTTNAPNSAADGSSFNVVATANSGLPVAITTTGVCTGSGTGSANITMNSASGTCTVHYNQAGDANYNAATEVTKNVTALASGQTITVTTSAPAVATNGASFNVAATANSGLTVAFTVSGGVCSVVDHANGTATITITSASGTCTVHYNQAGDATNAAAPEITEDTLIDSVSPSVTVNQAAAQVDPTNASPINFTVVFSKTVTGFTASDVTIAGTAGATTAAVSGAGPTYNVAISGMAADGTVIISIPSGAVVDASNNANSASTSTDNTVAYFDGNGPSVQVINISSNAGDSVLRELQKVTVNIAQFTVTFNQDVYNPAGDSDAKDVTNPNNYMLIRDLGDTVGLQTVSCASGAVIPADTKITINTVTYDNASHTATFAVNAGLPLSNGDYHLFVCGTTSIVDPLNNALALVGSSGLPNSDFRRAFTVSVTGGGGGGGGGGAGGGAVTARPTTGTLIPVTGFNPNVVTILPKQPADKAYKSLNDIRIEIPTLGINFPIVGVAETDNGWNLTWLKDNVGYLESSAYPTFNGNTVLTAHVRDANKNVGPFSDIKGMQLGDRILIHAYGKIYVYEVQENTKISPTDISTAFKHEDYAWITLVTCEDFNAKTEEYSHRRMVRAVLISVVPEN